MSDSQAYEEIAVASDGVSVVKRYEADEFPVPAIAFNFESDRGEAVTVRLSDSVPDDVAVEDLGFHPEYGSEYWDIEDDVITFEREIEPGAEYTTVYGIRATGTDNVEQFLTEPSIEQVDPPLEDDEGALVGEDDDAVKDVISGESDSVPGLDEEDEDVETLDLKDPNREGAAGSSEATGDAGGDGGGEDGETAEAADANGEGSVEISGDTLVTAMANELRQNNVSKEDVKLLRKAFDLATEDEQGSVKARVQKLQQDVSEVIAYTDALEEFLDENGTAEEIGDFQSEIEEFRGEISEFQSELESVQSATSETASTVDSLEGDVTEAKENAEEAKSEAQEVGDTVGDLDDSIDSLEDSVEDFESELDDLREEVEEIREETDEDVKEDLEEINDEIEELKEWREQLSSVIGGGE